MDPIANDYRLQAGSPAIDNALDVGVGVDLDGQPRPAGEGFDIGAYGFEPLPENDGEENKIFLFLPFVVKSGN